MQCPQSGDQKNKPYRHYIFRYFNAPDYRWFFNEIETYSTRAVENCGYDFLIQPNKNIHSQSNILRMVNGKMVDGLVIFSKTLTEAEYKFLSDAGIPYVYYILNLPFPQIYRIISFGMTTGRGILGHKAPSGAWTQENPDHSFQ